MLRFQLVALDMDGTLLTDDLRLTERTAGAIRAGLARGVRFVLATGRPYRSARPFALDLGLDVPLVCYNGAVVREAVSGRFHAERPIPPEVAAEVAEFLVGRGCHMKMYAGDLLYVAEPTEETRWFSEHYGIPYEAVGSLAAYLRGPGGPAPSMLVTHADPSAVAGLVDELERLSAGRVACHRPTPWGIDIVRAGTSKGAAVRDLAAAWGIPRQAVLAAGNAGNDVDLLAWAGWGVAVANATPELLALADWVAPDNNHDGVAEALEQFVL